MPDAGGRDIRAGSRTPNLDQPGGLDFRRWAAPPHLAGVDIPWLIAAFFILSLVSLVVSLVDFLRDVNRSLEATSLEAGEYWRKK